MKPEVDREVKKQLKLARSKAEIARTVFSAGTFVISSLVALRLFGVI